MHSGIEEKDRNRPLSNVQRAVARLRELILTNRLAPGSNHLESELADQLGMSRTPIREAAIILEGQGLLELQPRRGIRVLPISATDMEEIYSILTELESLAASDVASNGCSDEDLAELNGYLDTMEKALETEDRQTWATADEMFHRKLVSLAGNRRIETIVSTYSDQVHRARLLTLNLRPAPFQSNADHRALVDAIAAGDCELARQIHRDHRIRAKQMMIKLIAGLGFSSV